MLRLLRMLLQEMLRGHVMQPMLPALVLLLLLLLLVPALVVLLLVVEVLVLQGVAERCRRRLAAAEVWRRQIVRDAVRGIPALWVPGLWRRGAARPATLFLVL